MAEQLSKSIQNIMNTDPSNIDRDSDEFKEFLQDGSLDDLTQLAHKNLGTQGDGGSYLCRVGDYTR